MADVQSQIKMPAGRLAHTQSHAKAHVEVLSAAVTEKLLVHARVPKSNPQSFSFKMTGKCITSLKTQSDVFFLFDVGIELLELSMLLGWCV